MAQKFSGNVFRNEPPVRLGVIGYGERIAMDIVGSLMWHDMNVEITAICNRNTEEAKKRAAKYGLNADNIKFYTDAQKMLDENNFDGVMVGTFNDTHAHYACMVMRKRIPLFLEKPVGVTLEELTALRDVYRETKTSVIVSFPFRTSPTVALAKEIIDSGRIGEVAHVQWINNVAYGGLYYHNWLRDEKLVGGLYFAKATHDFDCMNYLLGQKPMEIITVSSKQVFKGDRPAGLTCSDCERKEFCEESPYYIKHVAYDDNIMGEMCCFASDTGNHDSGSALIRYQNGMHVCYSQNFITRRKAAERKATLIGYHGTIVMDEERAALDVYMHHQPYHEHIQLDIGDCGRHAGDHGLAYDFIKMLKRGEKPRAALEDGIVASLMGIAAQASSDNGRFERIAWQDFVLNE